MARLALASTLHWTNGLGLGAQSLHSCESQSDCHTLRDAFVYLFNLSEESLAVGTSRNELDRNLCFNLHLDSTFSLIFIKIRTIWNGARILGF